MGGDFSFQGNLKTTDHICFNYGRSMQGNIYLTSAIKLRKDECMLSNSVCIKSVTFDHIIQNEEGAGFVIQLCTAETQKSKQKCS